MGLFNRPKIDNIDFSKLTINEIAWRIKDDWEGLSSKKHKYPRELVAAMESLTTLSDSYYLDSGSEVVSRFIANSRDWNSYLSRIVKDELKRRLKEHTKK